MIGRKAWFGPRRWGWGLSPVTTEGWVVVATGVAAMIVLAFTVRSAPWVCLIAPAMMLAIVFLKGTSPGGPDQWQEFQAARNRDS